jgi:transcription-repair coupling factor (superfamily II helicase)
MERMSAGEIQVLVCTTIIERASTFQTSNPSSLKTPISWAYPSCKQIRGRVGSIAAPCLCLPDLPAREGPDKRSPRKGCSAIREFAEFNSGFKIAMRDLEIRGAGNLLGAEQSGHLVSVGYDMYLKLLEEAVSLRKRVKNRWNGQIAPPTFLFGKFPRNMCRLGTENGPVSPDCQNQNRRRCR